MFFIHFETKQLNNNNNNNIIITIIINKSENYFFGHTRSCTIQHTSPLLFLHKIQISQTVTFFFWGSEDRDIVQHYLHS